VTRELGDLSPVRRALETISAWEEEDRERRPENDPTVHALARVRVELEKALTEAVVAPNVIPVAEIAAAEGVSPWAIYKRRQRQGTAPRRARRAVAGE
jgi:hypothetical protein